MELVSVGMMVSGTRVSAAAVLVVLAVVVVVEKVEVLVAAKNMAIPTPISSPSDLDAVLTKNPPDLEIPDLAIPDLVIPDLAMKKAAVVAEAVVVIVRKRLAIIAVVRSTCKKTAQVINYLTLTIIPYCLFSSQEKAASLRQLSRAPSRSKSFRDGPSPRILPRAEPSLRSNRS